MLSLLNHSVSDWETLAFKKSYFFAGVDEVGRGCLAGPVFAAAVVLDPRFPIEGIKDSKQLKAKTRETLYEKIVSFSKAWSVAWVTPQEIDKINIFHASHLAMRYALENLGFQVKAVLVDGKFPIPNLNIEQRALIGGDQLSSAIGAASIVAKVTRDYWMELMDEEYPDYGFKSHKGYATVLHKKQITSLGPSPIQRSSFQVRMSVC